VITFVSADREETFYDIPVSFQGEAILEDRGLMLVSGKPTVTLTLYGNRVELNKLDSSKITIYADLSKIGSPGIHSLGYNIYYGDIPSNAFTVQSQYPGLVKVEVERRITKEVPVELKFVGAVKQDFILDRENVELDYENITVTGPASAVDKISKAMVEVDLEGASDSFSQSYRFTLCDAGGNPVDAKMVEVNAAEVNVTVYIKKVKEIPLVYTLVEGGGATARTSKITIDPARIKVAGNENVLKDLNEINLGTIDLGAILQDTNISFEIKLPEGVMNLSGKTEAVVSVSFPDLMAKTFTITRFTEMNVPEGMDVEFVTQELTITIRGPKEIMSKMGTAHISVRVDFTGAKVGTDSYEIIIFISTGFNKAGPVGTYRVTATLTEKPVEGEEP
jgi:YbbR domain-containing protein